MAWKTTFEGTHCDPSGQKWGYVIGSTLIPIGQATSPEMVAPGIQINWEGDGSNYSKALTGSSCEVSFLLNDGQKELMDYLGYLTEGTVGIFVFKGQYKSTKGANPALEWAGHLLPETVSYRIENELHLVSMTFTCGIGTLKHYDFTNARGDRYIQDRNNFERILFRAFQKLPSYTLIREYEQERSGDEGTQGDWCWLRDIGIPVPLKDTSSPAAYDYSENVLHRLNVHSDTFTIKKERKERHREIYEPPGSVNTYDVVEDICKCLGATIMWSGQGWVMFNRTSFYHFADNPQDLRTNLHYISYNDNEALGFDVNAQPDAYGDSEITISRGQTSNDVFPGERDNETLLGATEGRTLQIGGAVITHEDTPADWIIAEGMCREGLTPSATLTGGLASLQNSPALSIPNRPFNNQDQYSHNRNFRQEYIFDFDIYNRDDYNSNYDIPNHTLRNEIKFYNPDFLFGFPKRTADQISLAGGQDLQYILEGSVSFRHWKIPFLSGNQRSAFWIGGRLVLRTVIEVRDTGGTSYRLTRIAQTESSPFPNDVDTDFPANEVLPSDTGDYRPLGYSELKWVDSNDGFYPAAFYEIILPHGDNTHEDSEIQTIPGTFTPLANSAFWDNSEQPMYGGFCHEYVEEDDQLFASKDTVRGSHLHYKFMEDIAFPLPGDSSTIFDRVIMSYRLDLRDRDGSVIWRSGTDYPTAQTTPIWPDTTNVQWPHFYFPKKFVLNKACLRVNSGEKGSLVTQSSGGGGLEVLNMGSSRIGSRSQSQRTLVTGAISSGVYESNGTFNTGGETIALDGFGFENLRWEPWGNRLEDSSGTIIGPNIAHYTSLHKLLVEEFVKTYSPIRRSFSGQIKAYNSPGADFYRPYQIFRTRKYDDQSDPSVTVFYEIMFTRYSWSMLEGSSYEGILLDTDREINVTSEDFDNGAGGGAGGNGGKPGNEGIYGFTHGFSNDIDGITGDIDDLTNDVDSIKDTTDFITVTGDVDLDDIAGLTTKLDQLPDPSNMTKPLLIQYSHINGKFATINDGTSGQVLQTDGNGRYSFVTPTASSGKIILATIATKVEAITGRSLYYGDSRTSWFDSPWTASIGNTATTIAGDQFRNAAMTVLTTTEFVELNGIVMPQTQRDDLEIVVYSSPPTDRTGQLTLTRVVSQTITITSANVPVAFSMINRNAVRIPKGYLIWVMIGRVSSTNVTNADTLFTFTITTE